jgi:hypothetical protein
VDKIEYEAKILALHSDESSGEKYVEVEYLGYKNRENIWLNELLPSQGHEARKEQVKLIRVLFRKFLAKFSRIKASQNNKFKFCKKQILHRKNKTGKAASSFVSKDPTQSF